MNDLTLPPGLGLPADQARSDSTGIPVRPGPRAPVRPGSCEHECATCAAVFEDTQGEVESLRASLWREEEENYRLWLQLRVALAQMLDSLAPAPCVAGPARDEEFVRGWNQCVRETVRRARELQKVL